MNNLLEKVVPFRGKHKGETIRQILTNDRGWMVWMAENAYNRGWRETFQKALTLTIESPANELIQPTYGPVISPYPLSIYQQAIVDKYRAGDSIAIEARAGSGKSFMLRVLANMTQDASVQIVAFNKHIATELKDDIDNKQCTVQTIHSAALGILRERLPKKPDINDSGMKYRDIIKAMIIEPQSEVYDRDLLSIVLKLTEMARLTLTDPTDYDAMEEVASAYNVETEVIHFTKQGKMIVRYSSDEVLPFVEKALIEGARQADTLGLIDFTDMLWLVASRGYRSYAQADILMADECQDFPAAQIATFLALGKPGCQKVAVGDPYQAIQGFAFAAYDSFERVSSALGKHQRLTMPVTYRCPVSHVRLAQQIVPDLLPKEDAIDGIIEQANSDDLLALVKPGDLVICRTTAPLIKTCIHLLKEGVPAYVRGRAFHKEIMALIKKAMDATNITDIKEADAALQEYKFIQLAELSQKDAPESVIESLTDRIDCAIAIVDAYPVDTFFELERKIQKLTIEPDDSLKVILASGHRSKGDENKRVFVLNYDRLPLRFRSMSVDQEKQEDFLHYVILTRAKEELYLLDDNYPSILKQNKQENEEVDAQPDENDVNYVILTPKEKESAAIKTIKDLVRDLSAVVNKSKYTGRHADIRRITRQLEQATLNI